MSENRRIVELMSVSSEAHGLDWLVESLQAAVSLELATMPPYLCAYWSIKNSFDDVARSVRAVVREEMLHMGLACNLLVAIGGTPRLKRPEVLVYPGPLPGGVHPGLEVALQGFSHDAVATFMEIERPQNGAVALAAAPGMFPTIGSFYDAIGTAFETLNPPLSTTRQVEGVLRLNKVRTLHEVHAAIALINRQGEGSHGSPEDNGPGDLAHFYRFSEIHRGRRLVRSPATGNWDYTGPELPMPESWPMARVPAGGYRQSDVPSETWKLLARFDQLYTSLLDELESVWRKGDEIGLRMSVETMEAMTEPAIALMQMPIGGSSQTYGPCFRIVG